MIHSRYYWDIEWCHFRPVHWQDESFSGNIRIRFQLREPKWLKMTLNGLIENDPDQIEGHHGANKWMEFPFLILFQKYNLRMLLRFLRLPFFRHSYLFKKLPKCESLTSQGHHDPRTRPEITCKWSYPTSPTNIGKMISIIWMIDCDMWKISEWSAHIPVQCSKL